MLKNSLVAQTTVSVSKIAQKDAIFAKVTLPDTAVLLDVLKTVESELQKRQLIATFDSQRFNPLWFSVETERNIFLWRRGCSLIQKDEFEFWVDVQKIISKRVAQLERSDPENPFLNPLWSEGTFDPECSNYESRYLRSLEQVFSKISKHAHALSQVTLELEKDCLGYNPKPIVVLPVENARVQAEM